MKSAAEIKDHPLHPMLIVVPAGAFIITLVLDIGFLISGEPLWWDATKPVMMIGVVGAIVAAIPGTIDLFKVARPAGAFKIGLAHMVINLIVVALFVFNFVLRANLAAPRAGVPPEFWLTLAGAALLGVSGWLGWAMVYKYRVGVSDEEVPGIERRREAAEPPELYDEPGAEPA
ncbi:MAG: DUF2231 domain-containing protein [Persicimonas sp.]